MDAYARFLRYAAHGRGRRRWAAWLSAVAVAVAVMPVVAAGPAATVPAAQAARSVGTPTDLVTDAFTVCVSGADRPFSGVPSKLSARMPADVASVRARFEWWALGGRRLGRYRSPFVAGGTTVSATVPAGTFHDG